MIIKDILRVIYSPVKAFEEIVKKPDIKGPIIILALVLASVAIEQYVVASKISLATRTPGNDEWTESINSSWNWSSNGIISLDNITYVIGNYSIKSAVSNETSIWMKINNIGTLDCSKDYERLSLWINWAHQLRTLPSNSTLTLFSMNESQYFKLDASNLISKSSGNWSIPPLDIAVGPNGQSWIPVNSPSWENITGLEFTLNWSAKANLTMNIDDLYFVGKPFSFLTTASLNNYILFSLINTLITLSPPGFLFTWIAYVGAFFIVSALSHQKLGSLRTLLIVIGYTFAIAIVGVLVRAALYSAFPTLNFPISSWPQQTDADSIRAGIIIERLWYPNIVYLTFIIGLGLDIWIAALCAVSMRALGGLSWKKAVMFTVFAYLMKFFLLGVSMI